MPLNSNILSQQILSQMRSLLKAQDYRAKPTTFQENLAVAVATGCVFVLQTQAIAIGAPAGIMTGMGIGILNFTADVAVNLATSIYLQRVGSVGIALRPILNGIFQPIAKHLLQAQIISTSGMGGTFTPASITGWTSDVLSQYIIQNFPSDIQTHLQNDPTGRSLIDAVSFAFTKVLQTICMPSPIPFVIPPTGPLIAKFT